MAVLFQRIATLLVKHLKGELNEEENRELRDWASASAENLQLFNELSTNESLQKELTEFYEARGSILEKIKSRITNEEPVTQFSYKARWYRYTAAAAVIIAITTTAYFLLQRGSSSPIVQPTAASVQRLSDIIPGGNRATLTLGNGSVITLDSAANGKLAQIENTSVVKLDNGTVAYSREAGMAAGSQESVITYNTLSTPTGGQYQLQLPDGSKAWLNAASSITYPIAFTGRERRVEITGEVYFEVAKNAQKPFHVIHNHLDVAVLGTHFNVNSYEDEKEIKVTLLEGSVRLTRNAERVMLKPGQQAVLTQDSGLTIDDDIDLEGVIAWKNGRFQFSSVDLGTILRQAARWYNIEVSFKDGVPLDKFSGPIPRSVNLDQFLQILEMVDVHYKLEGRKLIVMTGH